MAAIRWHTCAGLPGTLAQGLVRPNRYGTARLATPRLGSTRIASTCLTNAGPRAGLFDDLHPSIVPWPLLPRNPTGRKR